MSPRARAFLEELVEVSRRHGLSLGHEDGHGAFLVEDLKERNLEWLLQAYDETEESKS